MKLNVVGVTHRSQGKVTFFMIFHKTAWLCMWLLRISSVRALKVGPEFSVIPHPNGSCHRLSPTHGWRRTKSQKEKRNSTDVQSVL
ncbi:hypothetical protein GOODEAATRI_017489 [Goodea atripinnis]|uniref:Secreted protein n=1 Tax=Goodea atripinnis TaxID=208336 RepID=A0ABV0MSX3_9TELE